MMQQRYTLRRVTTLVVCLACLTSCGVFKKKEKARPDRSVSRVENFDSFYEKFHNDQSFQWSRLAFPLEGKLIDGEREEAWSKDNWMMMKVQIYDINQEGIQTTYDKTPTSFYQKFWADDAGFFAEYRFELRDKKWFLVYAKDVNL